MRKIKKYLVLLPLAMMFLFILLTASHCGREKKIQVILISIDTLRADHLCFYGYSRPTSLNLSELADDSIYYLFPGGNFGPDRCRY